MMITTNKRVACTPFKSTEVKVDVRNGMAVVRQKADLSVLEVVYPYETQEYGPGDKVYVPGECCKHTYAKTIYEIEEGKPFILIPLDVIIGVEIAKHESTYEPEF